MPLNVASAPLSLSFPANTLVREFKVKVQADAAGSQMLNQVGQVRTQPSSVAVSGQLVGTAVVVDFGIPITVSGAAVPSGAAFKIRGIYRWQGDSFDTNRNLVPTTAPDGVASASFPEVSSTRLQLELVGTAAVPQAAAETVTLTLPALPADLEIRINSGPAVWRYPGPRGGPSDFWNPVVIAEGTFTEKVVDLTEEVAALLGNPDSAAPVKLALEVRSRIPGRLRLFLGSAKFDLLERVPVQPDANLVFDMEGAQLLPLVVGSTARTLKEVWLTVVSSPPKERAEPAVGPRAVSEAVLVLDSGRSACVRLPGAILSELTGLRLPLHPQGGSAEVRAQLLASTDDTPEADEPGPPLEGASATLPVTLDPAAQGALSDAASPDGWTLLPFDKPVPVKDAAVWASLQVARGTVRWSLGKFAAEETPYPVRRGPPTGPWLPLPAAVMSLGSVGGRLHAIGHVAKDAPPLAPVQLQLAYPAPTSPPLPGGTPAPPPQPLVDVTPTTKGVEVKLWVTDTRADAQLSQLRVVSRTEGMVTIQDLIRVVIGLA